MPQFCQTPVLELDFFCVAAALGHGQRRREVSDASVEQEFFRLLPRIAVSDLQVVGIGLSRRVVMAAGLVRRQHTGRHLVLLHRENLDLLPVNRPRPTGERLILFRHDGLAHLGIPFRHHTLGKIDRYIHPLLLAGVKVNDRRFHSLQRDETRFGRDV